MNKEELKDSKNHLHDEHEHNSEGHFHGECCSHREHSHEHHHHEHHHHEHHHHCACCAGEEHEDEDEEEKELPRIIASLCLFVAAILIQKLPFFTFEGPIAKGNSTVYLVIRIIYLALYAASYLVSGLEVLHEALENLVHGKFFGEEFLMSVATIGAIVMGEYSEACAVMILFGIGEYLEGFAVGKSRKSIQSLVNIRPDKANVKREENIQTVNAEDVKVDEIIVVKPGERVPLDGVIVSGSSSVDTAALTGESLPRDVSVGETVLSGFVNVSGVLQVKVTKVFAESTASRVLNLVENAQEKKAKSEKFITRFAHVYTPIVCIASVALAVIPSVLLGGGSEVWRTWVYRALELLVVSCPCALVISVPLSFFAGIGSSSRRGILIKGSNYVEFLSKVKTCVFDKTGTLTKGVFAVTEVHVAPDAKFSDGKIVTEDDLITLAAHAEFYSTHPISASLKSVHHCPDCQKVSSSDLSEISGHGVKAVLDGHNILCGNLKLMQKENVIGLHECSKEDFGTLVHVSCDGVYLGHIVINDTCKENSASIVKVLKKNGVEKTVMLTGDSRQAAESVSVKLGVDEVYSELLPEDKVMKVEELIKGYEGTGKKVLFAGDGINDAPVLSRSDVGVSMGAMGSDSAIEASDVVIMDDNVLKIAEAIRLSKKIMRNVWENVAGALGVKLLIMILCALGIANMWIAVFGDVGVCMLCVLNSMRLTLGGVKPRKTL